MNHDLPIEIALTIVKQHKQLNMKAENVANRFFMFLKCINQFEFCSDLIPIKFKIKPNLYLDKFN